MPSARIASPRPASKRSASSFALRTRPGSVREAISHVGAVVFSVAISVTPAGLERYALLYCTFLEEDCDAVVARDARAAVGIDLHQAARRRCMPALARLAIQRDGLRGLLLGFQGLGTRVQIVDRLARFG